MPAADARGTFHVDPVTMEPASQTSDHSSPERRDLAVPALSGAIPRVTTAYYPDAYRQVLWVLVLLCGMWSIMGLV